MQQSEFNNKYLSKKPYSEIDRISLAQSIQSIAKSTNWVAVFEMNGVKPSLSLSMRHGEVRIPKTIRDVKLSVSEFESRFPSYSIIQSDDYSIYVSRSFKPDDKVEIEQKMEDLFSSFLFRNCIYSNVIADFVQESTNPNPFRSEEWSEKVYGDLEVAITSAMTTPLLLSTYRQIRDVQRYPEKHFLLVDSDFFHSEVMNELKHDINHALDSENYVESKIPRKFIKYDAPPYADEKYTPIYVFPIVNRHEAGEPIGDFVLLSTANGTRLNIRALLIIVELIRKHNSAKIQSNRLLYLQQQNERLSRSFDIHRHDDFESDLEFRESLFDLCGHIIETTSAHSCVYLEYSAMDRCLHRKIQIGREVANLPNDIPIHIRETRRYLSAHVFSKSSDSNCQYIYLEKVRDRERLKYYELGEMTCRRNNHIKSLKKKQPHQNSVDFSIAPTASEIAFVIRDQGVPIGILSIESPYNNGFDRDMLYLERIIDGACLYRSLSSRLADQDWLRKSLQIQDMAHELKKLGDALPESEAKRRLLEIENNVTRTDIPGEEDVELASLEQQLNELILIESGNSEQLANDITRKLLSFHLPDQVYIPNNLRQACVHIVRNLIRNRRHTNDPQKTSVTIRFDYSGAHRCLVIRTKLALDSDPHELRKAFLKQIQRTEREHVGLYLIGVICRSFGGRLFFDRSDIENQHHVKLRLLELCIPF